MPIEYRAERHRWLLSTTNTAYAIQLTEQGQLLHLYYGAKLPFETDYPAPPAEGRLASFHAGRYTWLAEISLPTGIFDTEPVLRPIFADGTRDLRLRYLTHEITETELLIRLQDEHYGLEVGLRYRVWADCDLISRRVELHNRGESPITFEEILSGSLPLPHDRDDFRLTHLAGAWASEYQLEQTPLTSGRKVIDGRLLNSGHANSPFFALDIDATENSGEVWFGGLEWSGNWKIVIEQAHQPYKFTRIAAGLNDYDFSWWLEAGQSFETPWLTLGYTGGGFGQMSRNLHRYQLDHLLPPAFAHDIRPVLYNSWEAVFFAVNEADQLALAEKAARLGVEIFVMDDGWFGQRDSDRAGLGDWHPSPTKFPNGLQPLIEKVKALGMQFGLWVEPEMVNPDSDLYRAHPDWVYHFPNREPTTGRNQLILNLARPDVEAWMFDWLDKLLGEHDISYIKWDYNRSVSEPGWPAARPEQQREIWVRHTQALYRIVDKLRQNHPQVLFEACSGGGGRTGLGALAHFDHMHTSDNTDPLDRLPIQLGYSLVYAPKTMYTWVTHTDFNQAKYSMRYRFLSAFMGSLCLATNLHHWSEAEMDEAARYIAEYKGVRAIVQNGTFYRLSPLTDPENLAVQYLSEDQQRGMILAYQRREHFWNNPTRLKLSGLEPTARYHLSGDLAEGEPAHLSGQALMQYGLMPKLEGYHDCALINIEKG